MIKYIVSLYHYPIFILFDGLVATVFAKKGENESKWKKIALGCISKLKEMSERAPSNYLNKLYLLEAEMAAIYSGESDALQYYRKSISLSKNHCFINEEALACERAGMYFLGLNSETLGSNFIHQSFDCYRRWGATAKLQHIQSKYDYILKRKFVPNQSESDKVSIEVSSQTSVSEMTTVSWCTSASSAVTPCKR